MAGLILIIRRSFLLLARPFRGCVKIPCQALKLLSSRWECQVVIPVYDPADGVGESRNPLVPSAKRIRLAENY